MIDKNAPASQFTFNLPEPPAKNRTPPKDWKPFDDFRELSGEIALDFETYDPGIAAGLGSSWCRPNEGKVCGFGIAHESQRFYVGVGHDGGNSDPEKAWNWLRHHAKKPDVTFVYNNCIYDLGWLLHEGIDPINPPIDVQGMAALLDENRRSYALDSLLCDFLGRTKGTKGLYDEAREMGIANPYVNMHRMPTWRVDKYGLDDVVDTLELYKLFAPMMDKEGLGPIHEIERECYLVGRDLRWRGVRIDMQAWEVAKMELVERREEAIRTIKDLTGVNVTPNDNVAIAKALKAEDPSLETEMTSKGIPSIRAAVLDSMATPVSKAARIMRQMDKALGTFGSGYIEKYTGKDGRIHAEFHPLRKSREDWEGGGISGAGPGRWSSSNPNLTNLPNRDPIIGPLMRRCFVPEEGERWLKLDWASQEPRLTVHFAHLTKQPGAAEMVSRFLADPMTDLHGECAKLMGVSRSHAKTIGLAIAYGAGGAKIANQLGLPTQFITSRRTGQRIEIAGEEAQKLIDLHAESVPFIRGLSNLTKSVVERRGFIKTIGGRHVHFERGPDGEYYRSYKSLNALIQGSAADQMKMALVAMRREKFPVTVIVHDEVDASIPMGEEGDRIQMRMTEIMETILPLEVPVIAEAKTGRNWNDLDG